MDNTSIECEIDTGSRISAISEDFYKRMFAYKTIVSDNLMLRCYSGTPIKSLGYIVMNVRLGDVMAYNLRCYVIKNGGHPLLGRDWIKALNIKQLNFNDIIDEPCVSKLAAEFPEVFTDKLGKCKKPLQLQLTDKEPVYVRARSVPIALRARVERELQRLEAEGTISRVEHSEYGTPIVPVIKRNGDIRICGDYKVTINPKLKRGHYPLPRIEELFAVLSGGKEFTKIDLANAYQQTILTEDSQPCTAITTHIGTFVYRRTPFGLSCIPEKFQKLMEETLRGVPSTVVFLDDICCTGIDRVSHLNNLRQILGRFKEMGLTVKLEKCSFLQKSVNYLGFVIDENGLHPDHKKVEAISNAPLPGDATQLRSFLGLLNYYGKFIPKLSIILQPLHELLKKGVNWNWSTECNIAFNEAKQALTCDRVLAHYEEGRPLVLSVDSSAYGLGAVLAHRCPDGSERPVSCVSRTLNEAERNYSQIDKEALAIFYGITRHHQYLFGRKFELRTDHKPLSYIFGSKVGIPQTAASRLQRWAARLAAYDFTIHFVKSPCQAVRDAPPRAPLHLWEFPLVPWQRLHADFAEYLGKRYLILVDAHSKWIEALPMTRTDSQSTITALMSVFSRFGLPSQLVTDNGPPFFSQEFKDYCIKNCIKHVTAAPYRPQGNGAAENAVKTIKKVLKPAVHSGENVLQALNKFLLHYRNCDHATTGVPPAVLLTGRRMRTRLDALRPDIASVAQAAQQRQVTNAGGTPGPQLQVGEPVLARDYSSRSEKWSLGTVTKVTGPVSYRVDIGDGVEWRRHRDQILPVGNKSRLSLSRASIGTQKGEKNSSDLEENYEDASEEPGETPNEHCAPPAPRAPTPPPPGASARAMRAYARSANRQI
ncbi:hypothetical protein ABMA27_001129 [Loxostege sticticalis]|uniref:Integrase catalytic domain-containing protein n=1 Tax=Loxostege sticticalis TaxID=481309 RepID=A0ABR3I1M6_LOXSC